MSSDPRASLRNPKILVPLVLIFLCGGLSGALMMRYAFQPRVQTPAIYWTKGGKEVSMNHYTHELDLTPDQARQMAMILDDFMQYYHSLESQMEDVRADGKARIMRILTPEQQKKFDRMLQDFPLHEVH